MLLLPKCTFTNFIGGAITLVGLVKCYVFLQAYGLQLISKAVSRDFPVVEASIAGIHLLFTLYHKATTLLAS